MMLETSSKEFDFGNLLNDLPTQIEKLGEIRKLVLTDAVLLGEIPAPTFNESDRIRLTVDRFRENGLEDPEIDEHGNASAVLPGSEGGSPFLTPTPSMCSMSVQTQLPDPVLPTTQLD
jgi:hypothetical protein